MTQKKLLVIAFFILFNQRFQCYLSANYNYPPDNSKFAFLFLDYTWNEFSQNLEPMVSWN